MSEARRPTPPPQPPVDPRTALADEYLQSARAKLALEEAERPRSRRRTAGGRTPWFTFSVASATFLHLLQAAIALTFSFLTIALTYHMMQIEFTVGRVLAVPTGMITAAVLGYVSVCYLGVIESTSAGETNVELVDTDWKEWFWTLPASLGMLVLSAAIGWGLSLVLPLNVWWLIAISVFITYPILQLSSLETGSPTAPLSLPVLRSLAKHPFAWIAMYAISLAVASAVGIVARLAWRDPPYVTMLILGPVVTVALFVYAWLLGQLAHRITAEET